MSLHTTEIKVIKSMSLVVTDFECSKLDWEYYKSFILSARNQISNTSYILQIIDFEHWMSFCVLKITHLKNPK